VIAAIGLGGTLLFIVAALIWTARLVHVGNLDAAELAEKIAVPEPASALDWPELRLRSVVPQPGEPLLALLLVEWPAHREGPGQRSLPLLSQWCADRASVSPTRRGGLVELRRRQSLERVSGRLVAEDTGCAPLHDGPSAGIG
jgi:hypothetical protein